MEKEIVKSRKYITKKSIIKEISNGGLEKQVIKNLGIYVFGLVLFAALVFSFFLPANRALALNCPDGSIENTTDNQCEDANGNVVSDLPDSTNDTTTLVGGPDRVSILPNGSCPSGYTPAVAQTRTMETICLRGDLVTSDTAVLGGGNLIPDNKSCEGIVNTIRNPFTCIFAYGIASTLLWIFAKFVFLAGVLFDFSVKISIFKISEYFSSGVALVWSTVRDLGNIIFIFFLLWISIQTILGLDNAKKYLANIIITALLINFSLFFTRVIIDASNIVALQFYSSIVDATCATTGSYMEKLDGCISDKLAAATGLATIFNEGKGSAAVPINFSNVLLVGIFGSIFYLIVAFVLLQAAFMFIARTVALVLLAAISPIAFVGNILPQTQKYAKEWWGAVTNQALVAPIFLLFIWIVVKLSNAGSAGALFGGGGQQVSAGGLADAFTSGGSVNLVFGFFFLIGLLYFALKITKEYSGKFGTAAVEFGSKVVGGTAGWALRGTLGRGMNLLSQNETYQKWSQKNALTRGLHRYVANPLAGASYDIRGAGNIPGVGGMLKQTGTAEGLGKPAGKGGFRAFEKGAEKADIEYAKGLRPEAQKLFAQKLKLDTRDIIGAKGEGMKGVGSLMTRFIFARTKKSTAEAERAISKQVERKGREDADEERLKKMREDFGMDAARRLSGTNIEGLGGRKIEDILKESNKENARVIERIEEKYEEALEGHRAETSARLDIAKREQDTAKINILSKELGSLNTNIRKLRERKQLERTVETREARKEVETREARKEQAQNRPPEKSEGGGDSGGGAQK